MRSQSITLIVALFGAVTAVPCYELGWQSPEDPRRFQEGLDPFGPQSADRRWDIVDARDCWVRWQVIQPGQSRDDARVTKTVFEATENQVRSTMNNYFNNGRTNIQLWLPMVTRSLQYSYMLPGNMKDFPPIDPQGSLRQVAQVVVSIILPSAKDKLRTVRAARTGDRIEDAAVDRAEEVGITGLAGTIDRGDWAYIRADELELAMSSILKEQKDAFYGRRQWKKQEFAWTLAEKANGDCVVIDFRNFEEFVLRNSPASVR